MKLSKLEITNFRCFENRCFVLAPEFNLLVGENGSGKTSVLMAVATLLSKSHEAILRTATYSLTHKHARRVINLANGRPVAEEHYPVEISGDFMVQAASHHLGIRLERGDKNSDVISSGKEWPLSAQMRTMKSDAGVTLPLISYYGTVRNWGDETELNGLQLQQLVPIERRAVLINALNAAPSPRALFMWILSQEWAEFQNGEPPPEYLMVKKVILSCLEGALDIRFDARRQEVLVQYDAPIGFKEFTSLSDGQRNILALVGDIAVKAACLNPHLGENAVVDTPGIVLIDELDLHLHPRWQRRVINDLRRCFPRIQFIATTHSPFLVQALKPGELINLHENSDSAAAEYSGQSIEDITEDVMGVELPQRSREFLEKTRAAEEYFRAVRDEGVSDEELAALEAEYLKQLEPYGEDPAFFAALRIERESNRGGRASA